MRVFHRISLLVALVLALVALGSCSSPNPAAPPAPPAEIPSFLVLPNPTISVAEISNQPSLEVAALVGRGPLSNAVSIAPGLIGEANGLLLGLTSQLNAQLQIPVNTSTKTFEGIIYVDQGSASVPLIIKIDFADYDFDGDGKTEGCSGSTGALPICMRLWINGHKSLAGVFQQFPTADSPGAGRLNFFSNPVLLQAEPGSALAFNYDFSDPTNRKSELFWGVPSDKDPTTFAANRHAVVSQVGVEGTAKKSVNFVDIFSIPASGSDEQIALKYLGEFRQDADFWSGSIDLVDFGSSFSDASLEDLFGVPQFTDACARISSGTSVLQGTCLDLGIDVDDTPFTTFASPTDPLLPAAMPETPTF